MATVLDRLKLLMGGEEAFQQIEANATTTLQNSNIQYEYNPIKIHTIQQTSPINQELRTDHPKDVRPWTKAGASNTSADINRQYWCSALRRAQRYLGLRGPQQSKVQTLDLSQPPSYAPYIDPIILSLDIEADETNHNIVTEIGISTLDTRSIHTLPPNPQGKSWLPKITSHHFRITEYTHIRNHIFVTGNPETFNTTFGTSQFIPLDQIANVVRECFQQHDPSSDSHTLRNIILIGHGIKSDISWLRHIGIDLISIPSLIEVLDTEDLQKALKHDSQGGTNLARLLGEMEIEAWDLHNAGNDAAYTLHAFIAIVLKSLSDDRPVLELEERVRLAVLKATERATTEWKSWVRAEEKDCDGDQPVAYRMSKFRL